MYCTNCGWKNIEDSLFCEKCGEPLRPQTADPQPAGSPYAPPAQYPLQAQSAPEPVYMAQTQPPSAKKKKTGLIAGLILGGAAVVATVMIAVLSGDSPLEGAWYNGETGVVLEFEKNGFVVSRTTEGQDEGNYTYNGSLETGTITADGDEYEFYLDGDKIVVKGAGRFQKADDDFDAEDFLDEFTGRVSPKPSGT
jgi:hypothetical protein